MFSRHPPGSKAIYIAPLKALVRERIQDWSTGLCARLGKKMVELTGEGGKEKIAEKIGCVTGRGWGQRGADWLPCNRMCNLTVTYATCVTPMCNPHV